MPHSRRAFIRVLGTTGVVVAATAAGAGGFALTRRPAAALEPWRRAGTANDPRLRALSYAILAPNPHNRQPWMVELRGEDALLLHCDLERLLPETDPFDRQILIGLGCFLEILRMAAAEQGFLAEITPFPEGAPGERLDRRPVAQVRLRPDDAVAQDPLFAQVLDRRSNKEPFDTARTVSDDSLAALTAAGSGATAIAVTNESAAVEGLRDLTWRAHVIEVETPRTLKESVDLMRIGKAEIEANPDGIDLGGAFLETLNLIGLMTRESLADPASTAFAEGLRMYEEIIGSAMAYVWITTPGNTRLDQLEAGRDWVRVNLAATKLDLGAQPLSQALQEYPEMADLFAELHRRLGAADAVSEGARVQMRARLGYGPEVPPSPRWKLESKLTTG